MNWRNHDQGLGWRPHRPLRRLDKRLRAAFCRFIRVNDRFLPLEGYTARKDLFGVPYDWRTATAFIDTSHRSFCELVELSYARNDAQKVTIVGYSCGNFNLQIFLTDASDCGVEAEVH
jgi:hypothetical protein